MMIFRNVSICKSLFEFPSLQSRNKKQYSKFKNGISFQFDWMTYIHLHWAEMIDENISFIEGLLIANESINQNHDIYKFD